MAKTTRREFIKKSGFTMVTLGLASQSFFRHMNMAANSALTRAAALSPNDNILVIIQLAGGNDGLNMVIPQSGQLNSLYHRQRKTLAIRDADILPVGVDAAGNPLGFHPRLRPMKNLYDQGHVGIIQSVGYPNPNRSHFTSMDIWHSASPGRPKTTGWLGDYLDLGCPSCQNHLIAASVGDAVLPLSLIANRTAVPAIESIEDYKVQIDQNFPGDATNKIQTFLALNREGAPERVFYERIRLTALDAASSADTVQAAVKNYVENPAIAYNSENPLAQALKQVAQLLAGNLGTKILYVTIGGFDTHTKQKDDHAALLSYFADAVETFYRDLKRLGKDDKVLMMSWSEFGRKVRENENQGTDHGASGPQFVIGTPVKGGLFGEHPSLDRLDDDEGTIFSIDFRSIYATILEKWLGVDSREILGGSFELLKLI